MRSPESKHWTESVPPSDPQHLNRQRLNFRWTPAKPMWRFWYLQDWSILHDCHIQLGVSQCTGFLLDKGLLPPTPFWASPDEKSSAISNLFIGTNTETTSVWTDVWWVWQEWGRANWMQHYNVSQIFLSVLAVQHLSFADSSLAYWRLV